MLTAKFENEIISVHSFSDERLRTLSDSRLLLCPDCDAPLIFKNCSTKNSHFCHESKECSHPFSEAESNEHETGKLAIYDWLGSISDRDNDIVLERHLSLTNQRSDIFSLSMNTAFEFQCSPIQDSTWLKRRTLYKSANVHDIWILGYSMHKYVHPNNIYQHKLNSLELAFLNEYGFLLYYDTLTHVFVFILPEHSYKNICLGSEYFFKSSEMLLKDGLITSKYHYFLNMQDKRKQYLKIQTERAKETTKMIKDIKETTESKQVLASKKQINYIKYLLYQTKRKIPYKFNTLLQKQADAMIKELEKELSENNS